MLDFDCFILDIDKNMAPVSSLSVIQTATVICAGNHSTGSAHDNKSICSGYFTKDRAVCGKAMLRQGRKEKSVSIKKNEHFGKFGYLS